MTEVALLGRPRAPGRRVAIALQCLTADTDGQTPDARPEASHLVTLQLPDQPIQVPQVLAH